MTVISQRPPVGPPPAWLFPRPEQHQLSNGLQVCLYHLPGQYVISAGILVELPLTLEPAHLEGLGSVALHCLDEGTRSHPDTSFAAELERVGAVVGGTTLLSGSQFSMEVPVTGFAPALQLFAEALREPAYADADVARITALRLAELEQIRVNSAQLAATLVAGSVFDPANRASRPVAGSSATVAAITPDDVRTFHQARYQPANSLLVVAGDFAGTDPMSAITQAFGDWAGPQDSTEHEHPKPTPAKRRLIGREGSVQADIRLNAYSIDRRDPRWPALRVATAIMGGIFASRLNTVLREEKGYTYGVSMGPHPLRDAGYLSVGGSFRTEVVPDALAQAHRILDISDRPFTADELQQAVAFLTDAAPMRYATAPAVAQQALALARQRLDSTSVDAEIAAIRKVTPDEATQVYTELWPADPATVIVGDPALGDQLGIAPEPLPDL